MKTHELQRILSTYLDGLAPDTEIEILVGSDAYVKVIGVNPNPDRRAIVLIPIKKLEAAKPVCWLCKKPIRGKVHFQGYNETMPVHKGCLARPATKPTKKGKAE